MKKIKEIFNKHRTGSVVTIGVICLSLVVGFTVGNYAPSEYTEASQKITAETSKNTDEKTDDKTEDEDKTTLASLFGGDKKSTSKSDFSSKSSNSKSGSSSSNSAGSSSSSGSSSSKAETTCNHHWCYFANIDICDKCRAERTHTHEWVYSETGPFPREQYSVNVCHACKTHYPRTTGGCPNCGSCSFSQGSDYLMDYYIARTCSTCGQQEDVGWKGSTYMKYCTCAVG